MSVHWGGKGPGHVSRWPKAVGPVNTYSGATMLLDFLNPVLDPRITFSRGTNATLIDSTGKLTYAPNNLALWSQDFSNAAWAATTATKTSGVLDPLGGTTASTITATAGNGQILQSISGSLGTSQAYVFSIWLRRRTGTGTVFLFNPNGGGITAVTLTSSWARFSVVGFGAAATNFAGIRIATSGDEVDVAFAQLEAVTYQTTPSTYVATTASAYYGPRFDYDPVTLAPRGLLIEEARTNLLLQSQTFNATWQRVAVNISADVTPSPDGTTNADLIVPDATNAVHWLQQNVTCVPSTAYTVSLYVKPNGYTKFGFAENSTTGAYVAFNCVGSGSVLAQGLGGTGRISQAGNGWYRIDMSITTGAAQTLYRLDLYVLPDAYTTGGPAITWTPNGTSGAYLYGAQLEAGSFATSYIPTVASTVTRNADVATMTGTNFSSWYNQSEGTFVYNATALAENSTAGVWWLNVTLGTNANVMYSAFADIRQLRVYDGSAVEQVAIASSGVTPLVYSKVASAYKLNDFAVSANGGTVTTDTSGTLPTPTQMSLGASTGTFGNFNGWVAQIAYFNTRLPNAQLQTLTAPSLATTLSLDFTSGSYNVGF